MDLKPKISFCIISNGKRPRELRLSVKSIESNFYIKDDYEIIIVGDNIDQFKDLDVKLVEDNKYNKYLGARKNIGTKNIITPTNKKRLFTISLLVYTITMKI